WEVYAPAAGTVTGVTATFPLSSSGGAAPDISLNTAGITITANQIGNAAGKYLDYKPGNSACATGEVLKWNNPASRWECGIDLDAGGDITNVAVGTGLSGGGITGSVTVSLGNTLVTAGQYGAADQVAAFYVDAQGRLTVAASVPIAITPDQM